MQKATVELETVTPLFLGGAEPRSHDGSTAAELRPASFRGALRYWLRAVAGSSYSKIEASVFGDTTASGVVITRVRTSDLQTDLFVKQKSFTSGYNYLYWSMDGNKSKQEAARHFILPGTRFELDLSTRVNADTQLKQALASLWLLVHLGGIGSRSRRTAGSLRVTNPLTNNQDLLNTFPSLVSDSSTPQQLAFEISKGLQAITSLFPPNKPHDVIGREFDQITKNGCRIWVISNGWRTWQEAVEGIGHKLSSYRRDLADKEREVFGLPLTGRRPNVERRASPLWLHVTRLNEHCFVGTATLFKSIFLPQISGRASQNWDYGVIEDFMKSFSSHEVQL